MKKILTSIVVISSTILVCKAQIALPYFNDFENGAQGWYADTINSPTWTLGIPATGACSATHAWGIGIDTNIVLGSNLYTPVFNYSSNANAILSFCLEYNTHLNWSGLRVEYSTDNVGVWQILGNSNLINWYSTPVIICSGQDGWSGNSGGWQNVSTSLNGLLGDSTIQFRFYFCEGLDSNETVFIDNFSITNLVGISETQLSNKPISIYPNPFTNLLNITLKNNHPSEITLYDITSRKLLQQTFTNSTTINTQQLAKGIYFYEVKCMEQVIGKGKVVKE